jgi:hypothetical protein
MFQFISTKHKQLLVAETLKYQTPCNEISLGEMAVAQLATHVFAKPSVSLQFSQEFSNESFCEPLNPLPPTNAPKRSEFKCRLPL